MSRLKQKLRGRLTVQKVSSMRLDEAVIGLHFTHASQLAALTAAGSVWLTATTPMEPRRLGGHHQGGLALDAEPGGMRLASGGQDGLLRVWDVVEGQQIAAVQTGTAWVERVAWQPEGSRIATTAGRRVGVWNADGLLLGLSDDHASTVADLAWKPDGTQIATAAYGGAAYLAADAAGPHNAAILKGSSLVLAWQPQGRYLAVGNQDETVLFVTAETGETLQMWGFPSKVMAMAWSGDGRLLATAAGPGVILWDTSGRGPKGRVPAVLAGHTGVVTTLAWQPQGPILASGGSDGRVCLSTPASHVRDVPRADGEPTTIDHEASIPLNDDVTAVCWSTGGRLLAVGDRGGVVSVYRFG